MPKDKQIAYIDYDVSVDGSGYTLRVHKTLWQRFKKIIRKGVGENIKVVFREFKA